MRFTSEPGISTRKIPLRVRHAGRFDAPSDKAPKRPFLGGFDSSRTETRRCVFPPQKREKTATPTVGDKSSPDEPCVRTFARMETHEGKPRIQWISWISWIFSGKRAIMLVCGVADAWIFCGFSRDAWIYPWMRPYPTNKAKAKNGPLRRILWTNVQACEYRFARMRQRIPGIPGILGILGILGIFLANP